MLWIIPLIMFISRTPSNRTKIEIFFCILMECWIRKPPHRTGLPCKDNRCFTPPLFWSSYKIINRQWRLNYIFMAGTAHYDWHYGQLAVEVISFSLWWEGRERQGNWKYFKPGDHWVLVSVTTWLGLLQATQRLDQFYRK